MRLGAGRSAREDEPASDDRKAKSISAPGPAVAEQQPLASQWNVYLTVGGALTVTAERLTFEGGAAVFWNGPEVVYAFSPTHYLYVHKS